VLKRLDLCWLKTTSVISPKSGWECPHRWHNSGSCAIYVPKKQLDVEKTNWEETSAEDCKKYAIFGT